MRTLLLRTAGGVVLAGSLVLGAATTFAAETPQGNQADTPNVLPTGAISAAVALQDAQAAYPGATVVAGGVNSDNGTITYGFQVTSKGTTYDVQINALSGAVALADAGGADAAEATASSEGKTAPSSEVDAAGGPNTQQGGNSQQNGSF